MSHTIHQALNADQVARIFRDEGWPAVIANLEGAGILTMAGHSYMSGAPDSGGFPDQWPWDGRLWQPGTRQQNMEKALALYQAAADMAWRTHNHQRRAHILAHLKHCASAYDTLQDTESLTTPKGVAMTPIDCACGSHPQPPVKTGRQRWVIMCANPVCPVIAQDSTRAACVDRWNTMSANSSLARRRE